MRALKFLSQGAVGLYTGFAWPRPRDGRPGDWVEAQGVLEACGNGIHACRARELPLWIDDELWRIELGAPILEVPRGLVARRGRLLEPVEEWNAESARKLAAACLERALSRVDATLAASGRAPVPRGGDAGQFRDHLTELAEGNSDHHAATLLHYAADTAEYAANAVSGSGAWASCTAYTAAFLCGYAATRSAAEARSCPSYQAERDWQAGWLADRLGLDLDA